MTGGHHGSLKNSSKSYFFKNGLLYNFRRYVFTMVIFQWISISIKFNLGSKTLCEATKVIDYLSSLLKPKRISCCVSCWGCKLFQRLLEHLVFFLFPVKLILMWEDSLLQHWFDPFFYFVCLQLNILRKQRCINWEETRITQQMSAISITLSCSFHSNFQETCFFSCKLLEFMRYKILDV